MRRTRPRFRSNRAVLCGVFMLAAVLIGARPIQAADPADSLTDQQKQRLLFEAQEAYDKAVEQRRTEPERANALFREAAARYRQVVDAGVVNGWLYYNLGNAYVQAGEIGEAILSYRRAERLIPGDPRLESNLEYARSLRRDRIAPSGERALVDALVGWHRGLSLYTRFVVFIIGWLAFWGALAMRRYRPSTALRPIVWISPVIWLVFGASLAVDFFVPPDPAGVLIENDVVVRKGDGRGFEPKFEEPLGEGVEFTLMEQRDEWYRVRLPNDQTGWIPARSAGLVG
jgi:hypothetical protein